MFDYLSFRNPTAEELYAFLLEAQGKARSQIITLQDIKDMLKTISSYPPNSIVLECVGGADRKKDNSWCCLRQFEEGGYLFSVSRDKYEHSPYKWHVPQRGLNKNVVSVTYAKGFGIVSLDAIKPV